MPDLQAIIKLIASKAKSNFPWKRQQPYAQPYYSHSSASKSWEPISPSSNQQAPSSETTTFSVLSWNIDFMLPYPNERMLVALNHLKSLTSADHPSVIFLNECLTNDLEIIQSQPWIQSSYHITDLTDEFWESGHYGTCTLIPKSLPITSVFRVHYEATKMERDVLCVDVMTKNGVVRICNSHLESLIADPPLRPDQVTTAAKYMRESGVHGAVIGGDFNAIQPFDRTLHSENGLKDAFLEMGGKEDSDEGFTWGQMAPVKQREMFGCSRMDKLFYCGGLEVVAFERFGLGVDVGDKAIEKVLREEEGMDGGWVTDHAGVMATWKVVERAGGEGGAPKI
jgi:tyrosyl-DNA phosphodiesterase 2